MNDLLVSGTTDLRISEGTCLLAGLSVSSRVSIDFPSMSGGASRPAMSRMVGARSMFSTTWGLLTHAHTRINNKYQHSDGTIRVNQDDTVKVQMKVCNAVNYSRIILIICAVLRLCELMTASWKTALNEVIAFTRTHTHTHIPRLHLHFWFNAVSNYFCPLGGSHITTQP